MPSGRTCPVPLQPTYHGYLATTLDALVLIEACLRGNLNHVPRRPQDRERTDLIRSGNIFIYEESASGIKRWTDGVNWSPSRILGNFLIYRELEKPFEPGQKKRALKTKQRKGPANGVSKRSSQSPPGHAGLGVEKEVERALIGSLVDSYPFKQEAGLVKKTISVTYRGVLHHVVSYYTTDDVIEHRLPVPTEDPRMIPTNLPRQELLTRQNFRAPLESNTALLQLHAQAPMATYQHMHDPMHQMQGNMQYRPMQMPGIPQAVPFPGQEDLSWQQMQPFMDGAGFQHPQPPLGTLPYGHGSHQDDIIPFEDNPGPPNLLYNHVPSST